MVTTSIKLLDIQSIIFLVEFLAQRISLCDKINVQNCVQQEQGKDDVADTCYGDNKHT